MNSLANQFDSQPAGNRVDLARDFDAATPAERFEPIPAGTYVARAVSGALDESRRGTPYYGLTLEIAEGAHVGRRLTMPYYLSVKALSYSRRDLAALGLDCFDKLQAGLVPPGALVVRVALRANDDGGQFNEIREVQLHIPPKPAPRRVANTFEEPAAASAAPASAPEEPVAQPVSIDDLPFNAVDASLL